MQSKLRTAGLLTGAALLVATVGCKSSSTEAPAEVEQETTQAPEAEAPVAEEAVAPPTDEQINAAAEAAAAAVAGEGFPLTIEVRCSGGEERQRRVSFYLDGHPIGGMMASCAEAEAAGQPSAITVLVPSGDHVFRFQDDVGEHHTEQAFLMVAPTRLSTTHRVQDAGFVTGIDASAMEYIPPTNYGEGTGLVTVIGVPGHSITIDGAALDESTPLINHPVPVGQHALVLTNEAGTTRAFQVDVVSGLAATIVNTAR